MPGIKPFALEAKKAIKLAGGNAQLARRLSTIRRQKIEAGRVQQWIYHGIPPTFVLDVEAITGVPRHELRPDVFYADQCEPRKNPEPA